MKTVRKKGGMKLKKDKEGRLYVRFGWRDCGVGAMGFAICKLNESDVAEGLKDAEVSPRAMNMLFRFGCVERRDGRWRLKDLDRFHAFCRAFHTLTRNGI